MRIIGIDPGSRKTGYGIVDFCPRRRKLEHISHGVLRLKVDRDIGGRMSELAQRLKEVVEYHQPTRCAVEDIFVAEGLRSALMLGQARGAVLATMGLMNVPVSHFASTKVKLTITGKGRAAKVQVNEMVQILLSISEKPPEDAGDALAIAICCAHESYFLDKTPLPIEAPKKRIGLKKKRAALMDLARKQGYI